MDKSSECQRIIETTNCNQTHLNGKKLKDECPRSCGYCDKSSLCEKNNSPCLNNGQCLVEISNKLGYKCLCPNGFSGYICEKSNLIFRYVIKISKMFNDYE